MITPPAPQVKTNILTAQLNQSGKALQQPTLNESSILVPSDSITLSKQAQTPQQMMNATMQKLTLAQKQSNVSQKLFQTSKAIHDLKANLSQTSGGQDYLPALQHMSEQADTLLDIVDNPDLSTAKPHKLSQPETAIVKNMIFDLVHHDSRMAASARSSLKALGLSDHQMDALVSKIKEDLKKKTKLQFSGHSLEELMQEAFETVGEKNSLFSVVDQAANHFIQESNILFGGPLYTDGLSDARWEMARHTGEMASRIHREAQEAQRDRLNLNAITNQLKAVQDQTKAMREQTAVQQELPQQVAAAASKAVTDAIHPAVANGIQQGVAQVAAPVFQQYHMVSSAPLPSFSHTPFLPGQHQMHDAQHAFVSDWSVLTDFNKRFLFQHPDALPLILPQHAQEWYQLPESIRAFAGIDSSYFVSLFPYL